MEITLIAPACVIHAHEPFKSDKCMHTRAQTNAKILYDLPAEFEIKIEYPVYDCNRLKFLAGYRCLCSCLSIRSVGTYGISIDPRHIECSRSKNMERTYMAKQHAYPPYTHASSPATEHSFRCPSEDVFD